MAWAPKELFQDGTNKSVGHLIVPAPAGTRPCKIAPISGAPTLLVGTPMAYDTSVDKWKVWSGQTRVNEVQTITVTADGGTFTISFDGATTAAIAWNATNAAVQAALELLANVQPGDIVVTGGPGGTLAYTLTFGGQWAGKNVPAVTTGVGSLTNGLGAGTAVVATGTAGVADNGVADVRGFIYPDDVPTHATNDSLGVIMLYGEIDYTHIILPAGEVEATLKLALQSGPRERGLNIANLANVR